MIATTGIKLLALMQGAWANVVCCNPIILEGDWIAYYNRESKKGDTFWLGQSYQPRPRTRRPSRSKLVGISENRCNLTLEPPQNREEAWHLDRKYCYKVSQGSYIVDPNPMQNTYIVINKDEEGNKIKMIPKDILIDEEDMKLAKKYGLEFIKCSQNSLLYKAQMFWNCVNKIKPNKWVENYGINLQKVRQEHLSTPASSKVKGFMWLFCNHALPVGTRL
jgi:hypothetical protein